MSEPKNDINFNLQLVYEYILNAVAYIYNNFKVKLAL